MHKQTIFEMIENLTAEELALAEYTLEGLKEEFSSTPPSIEHVLSCLPNPVSQLIQAVREHEHVIVADLKESYKRKNKRVSDIGGDEVMSALMSQLPKDPKHYSNGLSTKLNYLGEIAETLIPSEDNLIIEIKLPLNKLRDCILTKQNELNKTSDEMNTQVDEAQFANEIIQIKNRMYDDSLMELKKLCIAYKEHLESFFIKKLESTYPEVAKIAMLSVPYYTADGRPATNHRGIEELGLDNELAQKMSSGIGRAQVIAHHLPNNKTYQLAIEKYRATTKLLYTLEQNKYSPGRPKSPNKILDEFRTEFSARKSVFSQRRDSMALTFLKGVLAVLSFGIATRWIFAKTTGYHYAKAMQHTLFHSAPKQQAAGQQEETQNTARHERGNHHL